MVSIHTEPDAQNCNDTYKIAVFEPEKLGKTFVLVHRIVVGNNAFSIDGSLSFMRVQI